MYEKYIYLTMEIIKSNSKLIVVWDGNNYFVAWANSGIKLEKCPLYEVRDLAIGQYITISRRMGII